LQLDSNPLAQQELAALVAAEDVLQLEERLCQRLEFGEAGAECALPPAALRGLHTSLAVITVNAASVDPHCVQARLDYGA